MIKNEEIEQEFEREIEENETITPEPVSVQESEAVERPKDSYPALTMSYKILDQGLVRMERTEWGAKTEVDVEGIVEMLAAEKERFEQANKFREEMEAKIELPEEEKARERLQAVASETPNILRQHELLPDDFDERNASAAPLEVRYDKDLGYARYMHHSILQKEHESDPDRDIIEIGGRRVRFTASLLKETKLPNGKTLDESSAVEIALAHAVAHERAHQIHDLYYPEAYTEENPIFERAEQISDNRFGLGEIDERRNIFNERFPQSVANVVVGELLRAKGYDPESIKTIQKTVGGQNEEKVAKFAALSEWAKSHGYQISEITNAFLDAKIEMKRRGYAKEAELFERDFRSAGYYLPLYDVDQLRYMLRGPQ